MLESLNIKNLALVEQLEIAPCAAFNAVTGETGAGKSLILGALKLLAGWRASPEIIRKGAKVCEASGVFCFSDGPILDAINARLEEAGAPACEDHRLLIKRTVSESGSRAFANGSAVTVGWLKELGDMLIDFHGPHDNQTILFPAVQLSLLDDYADNGNERKNCAEIWQKLEETRQKLENLNGASLNPEEIPLLKHQLNEIKSAALTAEEEASLLEEYRLASHSRHLVEVATAISNGLAAGENALTEQLSEFVRLARDIQEIDEPTGTKWLENLDSIYENLQDMANEAENYAEKLDIDEERLQNMEERLNLIQKLKRKYGSTIADVLATGQRIAERLAAADSVEETKAALEKQEQELTASHQSACGKLHDIRKKAAANLAKAIEEKLQNLGFAKAKFGISLEEAEAGPNGADRAEYTFSPNVGEDAHPLRKIASSGEIARVMLAIRTTLSATDNVPILVFDEIDANIGGRVAATVAEELRAVGSAHQIFSITHLPLIAAAGNRHFLVGKHVEGDRTFAEITPLEGTARLDEIVRMLGAETDSDTARKHAQEMLDAHSSPAVGKSETKKSKRKSEPAKDLFSLFAVLLMACLCFGCGKSGAAGRLPLAINALKAGDFNEASRQASICLRYNPDSVDALTIRGICQMQQSDVNSRIKAVRDLEKAHSLAPARYDIDYLYAVSLYQSRQYPAAIPVLNRLKKTLPQNDVKHRGAVLAMLGQTCNVCNQLGQGLSNLQFLQLNPEYKNRPEIYNLMAILALKSHDTRQALTYLARGLKIDSDNEALIQNAAVVYDLYQNNPQKARQFYLACYKIKQRRGDTAGCKRIEKRLKLLAKRKK